MCILPNPIWFAIDVINIVIFLLLWRIISMGHYKHQLERFRQRTKAILDSFNTSIDRLWFRITQGHLSERGRLAADILLLFFVQLVFYGIAGLL
jgi:hypothetical protein